MKNVIKYSLMDKSGERHKVWTVAITLAEGGEHLRDITAQTALPIAVGAINVLDQLPMNLPLGSKVNWEMSDMTNSSTGTNKSLGGRKKKKKK